MKKRNIITSISVGLLLITMLTACGQSESSLPFSREEAKAIAFKDAGVDASKVTEFKHEMDFAYGKYLYDMQFKVGSTEYDVEVNTTTGKAVFVDVEK